MMPKVLQYLNHFMSLPLEATTITAEVQACLGSSIIACQYASHRIICFLSAVHFKQWSYYRRPVFPSHEGRMTKDGARNGRWESVLRIVNHAGDVSWQHFTPERGDKTSLSPWWWSRFGMAAAGMRPDPGLIDSTRCVWLKREHCI